MIDGHVQAVVALLTAAGLRAHDGHGTAPARPYIEVQVVPAAPSASSLSGRRGRRVVDLPLQLVASNPRSVAWLFDRADDALLDVRLQVDGRRCAPADRIASTAADVTHDLTPSAWWATATYRIVSDPAPTGVAP